MPEQRFKSRSFRRVKKRMPSGEVRVVYTRRKPKLGRCGKCGINLMGVKRERPGIMAKLPKTYKRPERPFGGVLCSGCMREEIINRIK